MSYKGRFWCHDHQGKAKAYIEALLKHDYRMTPDRTRARFGLLDLDVLGRQVMLEEQHKMGIPTFLYPHAARPPVTWDGMYPPSPYIAAHFVVAEGHKEIMEIYGYPHPIIPVGWTYCPIAPFKSNLKPRNVLFAPVHPNNNGYLCEIHRKMNADAYAILVHLHKKGEIKLKVRYLHRFHGSGLEIVDGVDLIKGRADQSYADIDAADVVVAHQTFAYISVARGKPTIMFNEDLPPLSGNSSDNQVSVASWDKYKHLLQFPLDLLKAKNPLDMIYQAALEDTAIADWRKRIIGEPFDPDKFVSALEKMI